MKRGDVVHEDWLTPCCLARAMMDGRTTMYQVCTNCGKPEDAIHKEVIKMFKDRARQAFNQGFLKAGHIDWPDADTRNAYRDAAWREYEEGNWVPLER